MCVCIIQKGKLQSERENQELRHKLVQMESGSADGTSASTASWESEQKVLLGSRYACPPALMHAKVLASVWKGRRTQVQPS